MDIFKHFNKSWFNLKLKFIECFKNLNQLKSKKMKPSIVKFKNLKHQMNNIAENLKDIKKNQIGNLRK